MHWKTWSKRIYFKRLKTRDSVVLKRKILDIAHWEHREIVKLTEQLLKETSFVPCDRFYGKKKTVLIFVSQV